MQQLGNVLVLGNEVYLLPTGNAAKRPFLRISPDGVSIFGFKGYKKEQTLDHADVSFCLDVDVLKVTRKMPNGNVVTIDLLRVSGDYRRQLVDSLRYAKRFDTRTP